MASAPPKTDTDEDWTVTPDTGEIIEASSSPRDSVTAEADPALSIAALYDDIETALNRAFPRHRPLWVRGEIQSVSDYSGRSGHCYIDLIDPETAGDRQAPVLKVKCWKTTWGPVRSLLATEGIALEPGMVVSMRGTIDFYKARAEVGFILTEIDVTALLGRLAAERAALIQKLDKEGLLARNKELDVALLPLRVGLVASPGTEGYRDFLGQLTGSGFAFEVKVAAAVVQGTAAAAAIARAIKHLSSLGPTSLDLIVVVRGGGSKADLAAFDAELVARAIATASIPVWTGIGHTGDESVADLVAHRSLITPTECGRELATRVASWWEDAVGWPSSVIANRTSDLLEQAVQRAVTSRSRVASNARHLVGRQVERLGTHARALALRVPHRLDDAESARRRSALRLGPFAIGHVERTELRIENWRRLLDAYDVERQLQRGYSLTLDTEGRTVRSIKGLVPGVTLSTRFSDGSATSIVESVSSVHPSTPAQGGAS